MLPSRVASRRRVRTATVAAVTSSVGRTGPVPDRSRSVAGRRAGPLIVLSWAVRVWALVAVLDAARPRFATVRDRPYDDAIQVVSVTVAVVSAAVALLLAGALRRGRRRAWRIVTAVSGLGVLTHLRDGGRAGLVVNALLLVGLLVFGGRFQARGGPESRWRALRVFVVTASVSVVGGLILTARLAPQAGAGAWIGQTLTGLLGATPELPFTPDRAAGFTGAVLSALGASTLLLTGLAFLAPARGRRGISDADSGRLRALLAAHGAQDSLGYFALRSDKLAVFAPDGSSAVAYRVVGGVSLASGDPLGDPGAWPGAITAWLAEAADHAWVPGVLGASETAAAAYARAGLDALEFGDEAVLDLSTWRLAGRSMRAVRQAVNRARRSGHTVVVDRLGDLDAAAVRQLCDDADRFRNGDVERGFSMALGRMDPAVDPDVLVVRVVDADRAVVAVLAFVPWGDDGVSLDLMRRARDAESGTVELAIATLAEAGPGLGLRRVSLNFAVFRSAFERGSRIGAGPVSRLWRRTLVMASRWWQIESLYRANAKYAPLWVPRFLCFASTADLPRITLAALEAEAFVQRPRLLRLLGR